MPSERSRRNLLRGAAGGLAASLGTVGLAGCLSDEPGSPTPPDTASPFPTSPATDTPGTDEPGTDTPGTDDGSPTRTPVEATLPVGHGFETADGSIVVADPTPQESYYYLPYPDSTGVVAEPDTQFLTVRVEANGTVPPLSAFSLVADGTAYEARTAVGDGVPAFELGELTDGLEDAYGGESEPEGYLVFGVPKALDASSVAVRWAREDGGEVRWTLDDDQVARLNAPPQWDLRDWTHEEGEDGPVLVARVAHEGGRVEPFRAVAAPEGGSHWFEFGVKFDAAGTVGTARGRAEHLVGWSGNDVSGPTAKFVLDRTVDSWSTDVPWPETTGTETPT